MRENLLNKKENNISNAEKYAMKYFEDLKNHFGLTNFQLIKILKNCISKLKDRNCSKKWWQIFKNRIFIL